MANEIKALNIGGTTYDLKPEFADKAGKVNSPLKAGTKSYDGSSEVTITASDLGLSSALKYIGTSSTKVSDGGTESPTINGSTYSIPDGTSGQVVFYDEKEFVWNGSTWEFLGDDRNFKVIQSPVSDPAVDNATSTTFIDAISQDANGLITATKKRLPSYLSTSGGTITNASTDILNIMRDTTDGSPIIKFSNKSGVLGYLGISDEKQAAFWHASLKSVYLLIHSGNIGEYKAGGLAHSNGTIGAVVSSYGTLTIGASDKAGDGSKLYIDNNLRANSIQIGTTYTEGLNRATLALNPNLTTNAAHGVAHVFGADLSTCNAGNIVFRNIGGAGSVKNIVSIGLYGKDDILCCNGNGNVLIGTTTDNGEKLQVAGTWNNYTSLAVFEKKDSYDAKISIKNTVDSLNLILNGAGNAYVSVAGQHSLVFETNNTARMTINSSGAVTMSSTLSVGGNTTITGTCSASSGFFETSDSRLKDFKDPIKVDLDKLSKLTKAYFTFKNDPEKMHLGVSAQEIQEIYPEIVNENEEGFLSVDYAKLSVIALTAVDELNNRLNSIEERLSRLEK